MQTGQNLHLTIVYLSGGDCHPDEFLTRRFTLQQHTWFVVGSHNRIFRNHYRFRIVRDCHRHGRIHLRVQKLSLMVSGHHECFYNVFSKFCSVYKPTARVVRDSFNSGLDDFLFKPGQTYLDAHPHTCTINKCLIQGKTHFQLALIRDFENCLGEVYGLSLFDRPDTPTASPPVIGVNDSSRAWCSHRAGFNTLASCAGISLINVQTPLVRQRHHSASCFCK